jgi:hypothetical protein
MCERLRNRFDAGEVWWNRLFRLEVVAVKDEGDEEARRTYGAKKG